MHERLRLLLAGRLSLLSLLACQPFFDAGDAIYDDVDEPRNCGAGDAQDEDRGVDHHDGDDDAENDFDHSSHLSADGNATLGRSKRSHGGFFRPRLTTLASAAAESETQSLALALNTIPAMAPILNHA